MFNYYNWTEISTIHTNWTNLDSIISWEDSSFLLATDFVLYLLPLSYNFSSIFFSTNMQSPLSSLDFIVQLVNSNSYNYLLNSFFFDFFDYIVSLNQLISYYFISEYGDLPLTFFIIDRDYSFFFNSYIDSLNRINQLPVTLYDTFRFLPFNSFLDTLIFFNWIFIVLLALLVFTTQVSFYFFGQHFITFFFKFLNFISTFSFENRFQFDWSLLIFFTILFFLIPLFMTYDDVNVELIESINGFICYFFLFLIAYLIYKYSIHYFSFLENSVSDGFSTLFIAKQFVRDISNTFALFLRFFLLLFRLNIYDGLDDFLDSYYIFFIDFDEDSYFDELFFFTDFCFYFEDNREDVIFYSPIESDWWLDLYSKYFIIFGKIFFFWVFILEEIFRVSLALYISYLIIFEVHAVNISFNEDSFFSLKR